MPDPEYAQVDVKSAVARRMVWRGPILVLVDGGRTITQAEAYEALRALREREIGDD